MAPVLPCSPVSPFLPSRPPDAPDPPAPPSPPVPPAPPTPPVPEGLCLPLEALTVSARTVEGHVYRACIKLDVPDRDELAKIVRPDMDSE